MRPWEVPPGRDSASSPRHVGRRQMSPIIMIVGWRSVGSGCDTDWTQKDEKRRELTSTGGESFGLLSRRFSTKPQVSGSPRPALRERSSSHSLPGGGSQVWCEVRIPSAGQLWLAVRGRIHGLVWWELCEPYTLAGHRGAFTPRTSVRRCVRSPRVAVLTVSLGCSIVAYSRSIPLRTWLGPRRDAINTLADAHAQMGEVDGPGRPLEIGRPVGHAYVLRVVAEFQAFARDLHDLTAEKLVELSQPDDHYRALLTAAATGGRYIDRGNADLRSLERDFRRLGLTGLNGKIGGRSAFWVETPQGGRGDRAFYGDLIELRNCLAHGNQVQLDRLRASGTLDTVSWARARLPGLNRTARALDRVMWDHLHGTFLLDPW